MLMHNGDAHLRKFQDASGKIVQDFPLTPNSFWFLGRDKVVSLLEALSINHIHCETEDDRLKELGMHIGVHPDSNPHQTNLVKKIDQLEENVAAKADVAAVKADVAAVKADVAAVKADVAAVKADVAAVKADIAAVMAGVDTILHLLGRPQG